MCRILLAEINVRINDHGEHQAEDDDDGIPGGADKPDGFIQRVPASALVGSRFEPLGSAQELIKSKVLVKCCAGSQLVS